MQNIKKVWSLAPQIKREKKSEYNWAVAQVLYNRGFKNRKEIEDFLSPDYDDLTHDPFDFKDMQAAVDLIVKHIVKRHKIVIYGDYDADGVTSGAVLTETLTTLKADVDIYIPDRIKEGYGLNIDAVKLFVKQGVRLIVTVDGGIKSKKEVAYAKSEGIDVIITDHHLPPDDEKDYPDCLIVNPAMLKEKYPFKKLAGVGVAFKLAKAIISKTKLSVDDQITLEKRVLDLVAIGTISDCVVLRGENRVLTQEGIDIINAKKQRIGLQELLRVAGFYKVPGKQIDAGNIAYQIGPRINAAGRMERATTAFELLVTRGPNEARELAERLNLRNQERQEDTQFIIDEAEKQIEKIKDNIIIGVCPSDSHWNEGIVGLVAGKISEKYHKPALIITKTKVGFKGSGRSIPEYNIVEALDHAAEYIEKYGGHPSACGFSIGPKNIEKFKRAVIEHANKNIKDEDLIPKIDVDVEVEVDELDITFMEEIKKIAPFGQGNPTPVFMSRDLIVADIMRMGVKSQHIKFKITNGRSGILNAIGFAQASKWEGIEIGDRIDMVFYAEVNDFNGRKEPQLRIIDIKKT